MKQALIDNHKHFIICIKTNIDFTLYCYMKATLNSWKLYNMPPSSFKCILNIDIIVYILIVYIKSYILYVILKANIKFELLV